MSFAAAGALVLAVALGSVWVRCLLPSSRMKPRWAAAVFQLALAAGLGIGLTSCLYFLLLLCGTVSLGAVAGSETVVLAGGIAVLWIRRGRVAPATDGPVTPSRWNWILVPVLAAVLALVLGIAGIEFRSIPYGAWDAWAFWNTRAKFLLHDDTWRNAVTYIPSMRNDYPLLNSAFTARCWKYDNGRTDTAVVNATQVVIALASLGLLVAGLTLLRSLSAGLMAGILLLLNRIYAAQIGWQYADMTLAFYLFAAVVLIVLSYQADRVPRLVMAGIFASLAAWTKNEGLLYILLLTIAFLLVECRRFGVGEGLRRYAPLLAGLAPVMILALWFRLFVAVPSHMVVHQSPAALLAKLTDPARYKAVLIGCADVAFRSGRRFLNPLPLYVLLLLILGVRVPEREKAPVAFCLLTLGLALAGDWLFYLTTPFDLAWHLNSSFDRVLWQLWPLGLFTGFLLLGRLEDAPKQ